MNIAICKADGTKISSDLYKSMQDHANLVVRRLLEGISSDPHIVVTKSLTKSMIKLLFYKEFHQAILDLKAEKQELCLCAGHWKRCDKESLTILILVVGSVFDLCENFSFDTANIPGLT